MTTVARPTEALDIKSVVNRIWARDYTLWSDYPTEITDRLGWLDVADSMRREVDALTGFAQRARDEGVRHVILIGMGGSSLGAETLRRSLGHTEGWPRLAVLDSALPAQIELTMNSIDLERSLVIVSSKSGSTIEPMLLYRLFRHRMEELGLGGERFTAITDPGSPLELLARRDGFREIFLNPPDICGRYSVLSRFGLAPAALAGYDIASILESAAAMRSQSSAEVPIQENPGAWLGVELVSNLEAGRDKLTILTSPSLASFALWIEQLIAESLGKDGKGMAPVTLEPLAEARHYRRDRQFVYLKMCGEDSEADSLCEELSLAGHPVIRYEIETASELGGEFFRWQFATATAGALMGVHPFNQPDVERAKRLTREALEASKSGETGLQSSSEGSLAELLSSMKQGDYLAILAYIPQTAENDDALSRLRLALLRKFRIATTLGYGPRYLHSTGQLHKGGPNNLAAMMITSSRERDIAVPGENFTFGMFTDAQALSDFRVLKEAGRRTARLTLGEAMATVQSW